ncbi:MAG: type IV pilus secretin PilQ [Deltaproteobacteria bacterium]|nr:type IV pilus secretin PilQ [Deltaproteobacteria bacterium]
MGLNRYPRGACRFLLVLLLLLISQPVLAENADDVLLNETRLFSIEVRDAEISDVIRALAQQSGLNIIIGEGVSGKMSVSFKDIPFKDALQMIIKANGLSYTIQNNVFWVGKKVDFSDSMVMETVRLNYADPATAVPQLKGILSAEGVAYADSRTNSIILRDLPRHIERAKQLLTSVDARTPQVLIEARIVEASSNFSRQLGVQWGGAYTSGSDSVTGSQLLSTSSGGRNFAVNLPAASPTSGVGIILGSLSSKLFLDLELTAAESNGELKIVSKPKITTLNNKAAKIHSGTTFRVKSSQTTTTGSTTATTTTSSSTGLEEISTGIDLTVTPQISKDGYVLLNISTNKSEADFSQTVDGIPGVTEKSASTYVLVKNGDTVVIGGLYRSLTSTQGDSVPFLSEIPVIGTLFKSNSKESQNEELLVFISPKIVIYEDNTEVSIGN